MNSTEESSIPANSDEATMRKQQVALLLVSVLIVALCGIVYELIIASVSSYLLGNSVYQFSITIGLFMFAMGVGSYVSKWVRQDLISAFIMVEIAVALVGGISSSLLFLMFPFYALYRPVMIALLILVGALVGLEIPLLTRILSRSTDWKEAIANVLSLDYLGALIGSVAFPLIMLPYLGLFSSSFAIGLLNIGVAIVSVIVFRKELTHFRRCAWASGAVCALLIIGFLCAGQLTRFAESQLYADGIILWKQTPYQRLVVTENAKTSEIRLYIDKHIQFASKDEYRYHEALVHPVMSAEGPREHVLILGGGDGMAVREVLKFPEVETITLVDIDPEMTRLCSQFGPIRRINEGALESEKLKILNLDAFRFLLEYVPEVGSKQPPFDRVIIDLPDPHNEVLDKLYSKEFYEIVSRCMTPGGYVVTQSSSPFFAPEVFWCIRETLDAASFQVQSYHLAMTSFGIWGFHLGRNAPDWDFKVEINEDKSRYLTSEVYQASTVFGKDIGPIPSPVNRTFEPKLYMLYEAGLNR